MFNFIQPFSMQHRVQYTGREEVYEVYRHYRNNRDKICNGRSLEEISKQGTDESVPAPPPSVMQRAENWDDLQKDTRPKMVRRPSLYQIESNSFRRLMTIAREHYRRALSTKRLDESSTQRGGRTSISVHLSSVCFSTARRTAHHKIHN